MDERSIGALARRAATHAQVKCVVHGEEREMKRFWAGARGWVRGFDRRLEFTADRTPRIPRETMRKQRVSIEVMVGKSPSSGADCARSGMTLAGL